ncbi:fumarylacetoacetate hydrolase family protein [Nitrospirillum sp. BR 11163]|uniref:fumarylacetoacetate hydrolase family protein n=1 Tax=Nitrospirillum sp. BR 11163 TaxID=3104323 RepID=UPI002AFFACA2|nr:fumarylacetoacetate hydrolase family protein [Nitrospirillum sp. BR 11163]MEA1672822.1 fumarylacetoacetate hydrolase family protein [Nitrospirillum sp. BR 11163]
MKLARFDKGDGPRLGLVDGEKIIDLTSGGLPFGTMTALIAAGDDGLKAVGAVAQAAPAVQLGEVRLLAPIERPGKYLAIGMNYAKHLEEADRLGVARARHQTWFNKQTTCIAGPYDDIDPGVTEKLDYEVELAAVIGRPAKQVSERDAAGHVFGYLVANDVSARDWQFHTPTFTMGKSFDTHGPIGPWIVTADEIGDPHDLRLRTWVNGELRQDNTTANMIHNLWAQIAYLSTAFTLETGDLIATGTPEGVGVGREPPVFLQPGDVVRCEIEGIGTIENRVVRAAD